MMTEPFRVLCADPPWKFNDALGLTRGAVNHYPCMSEQELWIYDLPPLAEDCVLFLWRVASMQQEALTLIRAWGFTQKSELIWLKKTKTGKRWFGMGRTVRAEHEVCLIAMRGRPAPMVHDIRSCIIEDMDVDGLSAVAGRHSEKPEEFYKIVEALFDGPYCELFARKQRPGWTCLGNEVT